MMMAETVQIASDLEPIFREISDPEVPVLSIMDLGVVRSAVVKGNIAHVKVTPTYSGCPAMDVIADEIHTALKDKGYVTDVELVLYPVWTTDWITEKGRKALEDYGIAPPLQAEADKSVLWQGKRGVKCPQCSSRNTKMINQFGSTACKALFQCEDCLEPFDYFKCLK